jgi:hypothetical protein
MFGHQLVAQLLTSSYILCCIHHGFLLGADLFVGEDAKVTALGHVRIWLFHLDILDFGLFNQSLVLLSVGVDIWGFDCDSAADVVVDVCLEVLVNNWVERAIPVDTLTRYDDYAVCDSISDSSARDMLVNERARRSECAKYALFSASVTRSGSSAIATSMTKQMAVIAPATESNRGEVNADFLMCGSVVVCHVFEGVCLILVLFEAERKQWMMFDRQEVVNDVWRLLVFVRAKDWETVKVVERGMEELCIEVDLQIGMGEKRLFIVGIGEMRTMMQNDTYIKCWRGWRRARKGLIQVSNGFESSDS